MIPAPIMKADACVVIPNWNGKQRLGPCLDALFAQSTEFKAVVVDNGSSDGSAEFVKKNYPAVEVIELPKNCGFAGGVNEGISYALKNGFGYVALLNNDAVVDKNWLARLTSTMAEDEKIGIVSGKQLRADGRHIDSAGDQYSVWGMPFPVGRNQLDRGQFDGPGEIFSAPAAATLYRAELFKNIGLFDEQFFAYYEDVDISFRARLAGWKVVYQPRARVLHAVSATSEGLGSFTRYHATKNFFLLYAKNMPGRLFWQYLPLFALQACRLAVSSFLRGGGLAYVRGVFAAAKLTPHIISQRRRVQKSRKVPVAEIDAWLYKHRPPRIPPLPR